MPPSLLMKALDHVFELADSWGFSPVIAGGLAVSYWGHPRSTRDIDLAIVVPNAASFEARLKGSGFFPAQKQHVTELSFVTVSQWRLPMEEDFIDIEIDFLISGSRYHVAAIERAIECTMFGSEKGMRVLTCEDLLLFKAKSGRIIDLADIEVLTELHKGRLDIDYLRARSAELSLDPLRWT